MPLESLFLIGYFRFFSLLGGGRKSVLSTASGLEILRHQIETE
jgi:hypothetical protein